MGGLMLVLWGIRFFCFKLYESPKYLMGRGRDQEAVDVVHKVAEANGKQSSLTVDALTTYKVEAAETTLDTSAKGALKRQLQKFDSSLIKSLFATRKLAWSTTVLIVIWGTSF